MGILNSDHIFRMFFNMEKVYGNIFIDIESLKEMLKNMSYFSKGLKFKLVVDGEITEFYSENGLIDGINNNNALSKPFSYHYRNHLIFLVIITIFSKI